MCLRGHWQWYEMLLCVVGVACLAALRSYTLFGLSGCIVKFSFLLTFFQKYLFIKKISLSLRFYLARPSNTHPSLVNSPTVVFGVEGRVLGVVCAAARMLVFANQQKSTSAEHWCKATLAASAGQLCILFGSIKQCVLA